MRTTLSLAVVSSIHLTPTNSLLAHLELSKTNTRTFPMDPITQQILARKAERQKRASVSAAARKRAPSNLKNATPKRERAILRDFAPKRPRLDSHASNASSAPHDDSVESKGTSPPPRNRKMTQNELFSPTRNELSDALRSQCLENEPLDTETDDFDAGASESVDSDDSWLGFNAAGLLSPDRDAEIRVFSRRSLSPVRTSEYQTDRLDSGAGSRSSSIGSSDSRRGGPDMGLGKGSYSVTMMSQNSTVRAMHDNDVIKLLLQEATIQEDIERQASQALDHMCSGSTDSGVNGELEGERLLRIAAERRIACMQKVEELKKKGDDTFKEVESCTANIVLSDISFPLDPEFVTSLKQKYDHECFSFFCLVRLDETNIAGTHLLSTHEKDFKGGLHFTNTIVLHGASPQFKISLEVYGMHTRLSQREYKQLHRSNSAAPGNKIPKLQSLMASARHNSPLSKMSKAKKLQAIFGRQSHRRQAKLSGKKLFGSEAKDVEKGKRVSRFVRLGKVKINSVNCKMTTFQLQELSGDCLLGPLHLKVRISLESSTNHKGFLTCHDGMLWNRRWTQLENGSVKFWKYPDDAKHQPLESITLFDFVGGSVSMTTKEECVRPHAFFLLSSDSSQKKLLAADSKEEKSEWCDVFQEALNGYSLWKSIVS